MKKQYPLIFALLLLCSGLFANGHTVTPTIVKHVSCPAGTDGRAYVTVSGGVGPFTFSWNSTPIQTTDTLSSVAAGNYICTVTDQNDMSVTTATITINNGLMFSASSNGLTCDGGTINLFGINVTNPLWAGPNGFTSSQVNPLIQPAFQNAAGTYTLQGTSSTGCVGSTTINVMITPPIFATVNTQQYPSCFGSCDGSLTAAVTGGTGNYTYSWTNGATTQTINGLCGGTNYTVSIFDGGTGCMTTATSSLSQPQALTAVFNTVNPSACGACDGNITATPLGGSAPYVYAWSQGNTTPIVNGLCPGTYQLYLTDANGCTATLAQTLTSSGTLSATANFTPDTCGQSLATATIITSGAQGPVSYVWQPNNFTTQSIANVTSGIYTYTVSDSVCSFTNSISIGNIGSPIVIASSNPATCGTASGVLFLSASGGTGAYQYSINGSPFSSNQTYSNLLPGPYSIVCQDAVGCLSSTLNYPVTNNGLNLYFYSTGATCGSNNGTVNLNVVGGTPPYTYAWSNGQNTPAVVGLLSGTYTCTVTDNAGCTASGSVNVSSQATIYLSYDYDFSNCGVNSLTAQPYFGNGTYSYIWSPGGQTTPTISNQAPGTYTCTVTDANGCNGVGVFSIYNADYSIVRGRYYADLNNNCSMDPGENTNQYMYISATNAANQQVGYSYNYLQNGQFEIYLPNVANTYTLNIINPYSYNYSNFTFNCTNNVITTTGNCDTLQNIDLGYAPITGLDLHVQGYCGWARPGFQRSYWLSYGNPGTISANSTVKMHVDNLLSFAGSTPPPTAINGNTLEWNVGTLNHGDYGAITVLANVPTIQNGGTLGTVLHDSIWIEPSSGDNYPSDNNYFCSGQIVGSYDPNFKEVFAENMDQSGAIDTSATELFYTVHFQNTGTDTAFTITVRDTISPLLDLSTLEVLAASHNYSASLLPNRTLQIRFDHILLPDSNTNEALSHGYFHYKIRTNNGLQVGQHIDNTAGIYFDFNLPVITNTVETPIQLNTIGIKSHIGVLNAHVYPNPTNSSGFKISLNDASYKGLRFSLYDVSGTKVIEKHLPAQPQHEIGTAGLSNGIYFYQLINSEGKKLSGKIIISN